jgi:hypothetical protein
MVFNPNSRESCEYYGKEFHGEPVRQNLMPHPVEYTPQQSRDYAFSNTIHCECTVCPINKGGYCSVPSAIVISSGGRCTVGAAFIDKKVERDPETIVPGKKFKDEWTPFWFYDKYGSNCPKLTPKELKELKEVKNWGSEFAENYDADVLTVNTRKK